MQRACVHFLGRTLHCIIEVLVIFVHQVDEKLSGWGANAILMLLIEWSILLATTKCIDNNLHYPKSGHCRFAAGKRIRQHQFTLSILQLKTLQKK
jgi:hypothetical protein